MKRAIWQVFLIMVFLHLILTIGFGCWLYTSGRLSKDRVTAVYEMFKPTVVEQQATDARLAAEAEEELARQEEAIRLKKAGHDGPLTPNDRILAERQMDETAQLKLDRLDRAKADIQGQIERAQAALAEQSAQLEAARAAFDAHVAQRTEQLTDADFKQAVALLSAQKPRQAKAMLQTMLAAGAKEKVVDYLAAMNNRASAAILAEFKDPAEVQQATDLVNALRERGNYTMGGSTGDTGA